MNFLAKLFARKPVQPTVIAPARFPEFNNISSWME